MLEATDEGEIVVQCFNVRKRKRYINDKDGEVSVEEAKNKTGNGNQNETDRILNKSEMDNTRGGGNIWKGERCAGVKPGGCNW